MKTDGSYYSCGSRVRDWMNKVNDRDYYEMERMVAEDVSMLSGKKLSFAEIILSFVPKEGIRSRTYRQLFS